MELIAAQYRGRARVLQAKLFVLFQIMVKKMGALYEIINRVYTFCSVKGEMNMKKDDIYIADEGMVGKKDLLSLFVIIVSKSLMVVLILLGLLAVGNVFWKI